MEMRSDDKEEDGQFRSLEAEEKSSRLARLLKYSS